jgi:hypothetical protein
MGGDFIAYSHQVDLGEDGTTEKLIRVVVDMTYGEAARDGPGVECSVVAARTRTVVLGDDV